MSKISINLLELGRLLDDGKSTKELAEYFKVSTDTIRRRKKDLDKLKQKEKEKRESTISIELDKLVEKENGSSKTKKSEEEKQVSEDKPIKTTKTSKSKRLPSQEELNLDPQTNLIRRMRLSGVTYADIVEYTGISKKEVKETCDRLVKEGKLPINIKTAKKLDESRYTKLVDYSEVCMKHKIVSLIIGEHRYVVDRSKWNDGLALVCVLAFVESNTKFKELVFSGLVNGSMATNPKLLHGKEYIAIGGYYIRTDNTAKDCALLIDKVCTEVLNKKVKFEVR